MLPIFTDSTTVFTVIGFSRFLSFDSFGFKEVDDGGPDDFSYVVGQGIH
jgi:hypothetical protein